MADVTISGIPGKSTPAPTDLFEIEGGGVSNSLSLANMAANMPALDLRGNTVTGASVLINTQISTSYTLVLTDRGKLITMDNAAANTLFIPTNATIPFPIGTRIEVAALGSGVTTFSITTDTIVSKDGLLSLTAQFSGATLTKIEATVWLLVGDLD